MEKNPFFKEIHGRFAFGCMRLPMIGDQVDIPQFKAMAKAFIEKGFNYFDTAHGYIDGKSELAIREAVSSVFPREKFLLTNKLSSGFFNSQEEIRPLFQQQLECCGVEYFDFYLMHAMNARLFEKYKACHAFETAFELKKEGKIRHVGFSFHDTPEVLDQILTEYPQVEVVQIQFNYLDYEDVSVESRKCYEVCVKHGKPNLIMEPVKGGRLVNLPPEGAEALARCNAELGVNHSNASYAVRFAASFPNVACVLSGMSNFEQMEDNLSSMKDFVPLNKRELQAVHEVVDSFAKLNLVPCTKCRYCVEENHCPMGIEIPRVFGLYNAKKAFNEYNQVRYYEALVEHGGAASSCIECGGCEAVCPQHLPIRDLLKDVAKEFEGK